MAVALHGNQRPPAVAQRRCRLTIKDEPGDFPFRGGIDGADGGQAAFDDKQPPSLQFLRSNRSLDATEKSKICRMAAVCAGTLYPPIHPERVNSYQTSPCSLPGIGSDDSVGVVRA